VEENEMKQNFKFETTSMSLHILAMIFMLCDHLWATIIPGNDWLTCIGRLTFPIFAFLIVEGYFHTHNLKKYIKRLLIFAILSEIPFNYVMGSNWFYPIHQNVLWTFLLSIGLIHLNEIAKKKNNPFIRIITGIGTILLANILGIILFVDYYNAGVLMVLVFYFLRGRKWWNYVGQFLLMYYINIEMLSGFAYELELFGQTHYFVRQGFALLALIPIWLYCGNEGYKSKVLQYIYYGFYPVHLLILAILRFLILR